MAFLYFPLEVLPFIFLVIIIAFTFHEFSHAFVAYKFGDDTAYKLGRVTLNPMAHFDLFGTLLIFLAGFGWAKPVPVNRSNFKHPKLMSIVVSAVGPLSNLLLGFIGVLIYYIYIYFGWDQSLSYGSSKAIETFLQLLIDLNLLLFIFNLIPLPPLDGYRMIEDLVPRNIRLKLSQWSHWAIFIFLLIVFIPPLNHNVLQPILALRYDVLRGIENMLSLVFH